MPSDHYLPDSNKFNNLIKKVLKNFDDRFIYLFGTKPQTCNSTLGYIQAGKKLFYNQYLFKKFYEKPKSNLANKLFKQKNIFWNLGIFMFSIKTLINELKIHASKTLLLSKEIIKNSEKKFEFISFSKKDFEKNKRISFDKLLLEKTKNIRIIKTNFKWSDFGSWHNLKEVYKKDKENNSIDKNVVSKKISNCLIKINDGTIALVMGIDDVTIIRESDALLISNNKYLDELKEEYIKIKKKKFVNFIIQYLDHGEVLKI